jgi:hypothetical protein
LHTGVAASRAAQSSPTNRFVRGNARLSVRLRRLGHWLRICGLALVGLGLAGVLESVCQPVDESGDLFERSS